MARFEYKAFDEEKHEHEGIVDAATEEEAVIKLEELNLVPLSLDELNFDGSRKEDGVLGQIGHFAMPFQFFGRAIF